nr:GNAT family N-acetyltransferase [uncultured Acetatifactor sp.]
MNQTALQFDNHDCRIRYYELLLEQDLDNLPCHPLPDDYHFVFYQPGDRDAWIDIEKSAKEFSTYEQGLEAWNRYYGGREESLLNRMVFVEDAEGRKVATATAYYDITGRDRSGSGWLHWVAVRREHQGKGLAKPLIVHVLDIMRGLGYTHAKIPTQTTTWLACKVYLDLGFVPLPQNAVNSKDGWRIVKALTDHRALQAFDAASMEEILAKGIPGI